MAGVVKFIVYANGTILNRDSGPEYDKPPIEEVGVRADVKYSGLLTTICKSIGVNPTVGRVEIIHRCPHIHQSGERYTLMPIQDDGDALNLIKLAQQFGEGHIQELFVLAFGQLTEGYHTLVSWTKDQDHPHINPIDLACCFQYHVWDDPNVRIADLQSYASLVFGYKVSDRLVWEGKIKALADLYRGYYTSYNELPKLLFAIKATNPGTQVEWGLNRSINYGGMHLKWVFWTFRPCVEAFKFSRPVVCVHGIFLYGEYNHVLLVACGVDGDNKMIPLAFCIAPSESKEAWGLFLRKIKQHVIGHQVGETVCLISDRRPGVIEAYKEASNGWQPPFAVQRFCIRHVARDFNKVYSNERCRNLTAYAATQAQPRKFERLMEMVRDINEDAIDWFNRTECNGSVKKEEWTLAYDGFHRFGVMASNIKETCYDSVLKGVRGLPVSALVKRIFYNCVKYWNDKHVQALKAIEAGEVFTKYAKEKIDTWRQRANSHRVVNFHQSTSLYEVLTGSRRVANGLKGGGNTHKVDLGQQTCTCNKWQIYRIPCSHAFSIAAFVRMDMTAAIGVWYKWTHQLQCYHHHFSPLGDELDWPTPSNFPRIVPDPNSACTMVKLNRKRNNMEMGIMERPRRVTCSYCRREGHNRRVCPQVNRQGK